MKPDKKETALTGNREPNYMAIVFECRDLLDCGHVDNVPESLQEMRARYNDALARIAQLESAAPELIAALSRIEELEQKFGAAEEKIEELGWDLREAGARE